MTSRSLTILFAAGLTVALMLLALWAWFGAPVYAAAAERPDVLRWSLRSLAVASAAGAQLIALTLVVGRLYPRPGAMALRFAAAIVCCVAAVSAAALGVAARG